MKVDISKLFYSVLRPAFSLGLAVVATHVAYSEIKKVVKETKKED